MLPATFPRWHAHIDVWLLVAGLLVAYFWALMRHWESEPGTKHCQSLISIEASLSRF